MQFTEHQSHPKSSIAGIWLVLMEAVEMQAGWGLLPPCHEIKGSITLHLLSIPFQDIVDIC
jgi:hypothetical protein